MRIFSRLLAGVIVFACPVVTRANLLTNGSFENFAAHPDSVGITVVPAGAAILAGWQVSGYTIDLVPTPYWRPTDGQTSVDLAGTGGMAAITQIVPTDPGGIYHLSFDFSANPENYTHETNLTKTLLINAVDQGRHVVGSETLTNITGHKTNADMQFVYADFTFTADTPYTALTFAGIAPAGYDPAKLFCGPVIDHAILEKVGGAISPPPPPTPEPASIGMLAIGALLLFSRRFRG